MAKSCPSAKQLLLCLCFFVFSFVFTYRLAAQPVISSFSPNQVTVGQTVTIKGAHFSRVTQVLLNGVPAESFSIITDSLIYAVVARKEPGPSSQVELFDSNGKGSDYGLTVSIPAPSITSFFPISGKEGDTITIKGTNLEFINRVDFGSAQAAGFTIINDSTIKAVVRKGVTGATSGTIKVLTLRDWANSKETFTYTGTSTSTILSFSPIKGPKGGDVHISYYNRPSVISVKIAGAPAMSFFSSFYGDLIARAGNGNSNNHTIEVETDKGIDTISGFTFLDVPYTDSIKPATAHVGDTVMIYGSYFADAFHLEIGRGSTPFRVLNDSVIMAVIGASSNSGDVVVRSPLGYDSTSRKSFDLLPSITGFTPAIGTTGTTVTIKGVFNIQFNTLQGVTFGGVPAASFSRVNDSTITAVVATGATGPIAVNYWNNVTGTSKQPFIFAKDGPSITSFTPAQGAPGDSVTVKGRGFTSITTASVGGVNVRLLHVYNDSTIGIRLGSGADGRIVLKGVTGADSSGTRFKFIYTKPFISQFGPDAAGAGDTVFIWGNDFIDIKGVSFGGTSAASFKVFEPDYIQAIVGKGASGNVTITTSQDSASKTGFTFLARAVPEIKSFSPAQAAYNQQIRIRGSQLDVVTGVIIGGVPAKSYTISGDTLITAVLGRGIGVNNYIRLNSSMGPDTLAGFTVLSLKPHIIGFTPTWGKAGTVVSFTGTDMDYVTDVYFGGVKAASYKRTGDSTITAVVGNGATGKVTVYSAAGYDTARSAGFTFITDTIKPVVSSFTPTSARKGDTVIIRGSGFVNISNVSFGGVAADSFRVLSASAIKAWVGNGSTGHVKVAIGRYADSLGGFTFMLPQPDITSFVPATATLRDTVIIKGENFVNITGVYFGNTPADSFSVLSPVAIKAWVGRGASGAVKVTATTGTDSLAGFTFTVPKVKITSFSPKEGLAGTVITITGTNLDYAKNVGYAVSSPAASFKIVSPTRIDAVVGNSSLGAPVVWVSNASSYDSMGSFNLLPPVPELESIAPTAARAGDTVIIRGGFFLNVKSLTIGGVPAAAYTVLASNTIRARVGNNAINDQVVITTASGADTLKGFIFITPAVYPQITSFTPAGAGPGGIVSINGKNFTGTTAVRIGGVPAASFTTVSDTRINAVVAANAATVNASIIVTTSLGIDTAYGFYILPPAPVVHSLEPSSATAGETVVIKGWNFGGATNVSFGGKRAASYVVVSASQINAVVDSGATGAVVIVTPNGKDSSATFTYLPPAPRIKRFTPTTGKTGTNIQIFGSRFRDIVSVSFGGVKVGLYNVSGDTLINAMVGLGATGAVKVTTKYGVDSMAGFTYPGLPPSINDFYPSSGTRGDVITITGSHFTGATFVIIAGTHATSFEVVSDSEIRAVLGTGSNDGFGGLVSVTTPGGNMLAPGFRYISAGTFNLSNFKAVLVKDKVTISWNTDKERYTDYFMLTWAAGSETLLQNRVAAAGTSDSIKTYSFTYPVTKTGRNTVRLRMYDKMGNVTYSDSAVFIVDAALFANLGIYPNPATESVTVQHPASDNGASILMFNMNGTLVRTQAVKAGDMQTHILFGSVPKGMYKLVWTDGATSKTTTVVVQ